MSYSMNGVFNVMSIWSPTMESQICIFLLFRIIPHHCHGDTLLKPHGIEYVEHAYGGEYCQESSTHLYFVRKIDTITRIWFMFAEKCEHLCTLHHVNFDLSKGRLILVGRAHPSKFKHLVSIRFVGEQWQINC